MIIPRVAGSAAVSAGTTGRSCGMVAVRGSDRLDAFCCSPIGHRQLPLPTRLWLLRSSTCRASRDVLLCRVALQANRMKTMKRHDVRLQHETQRALLQAVNPSNYLHVLQCISWQNQKNSRRHAGSVCCFCFGMTLNTLLFGTRVTCSQ